MKTKSQLVKRDEWYIIWANQKHCMNDHKISYIYKACFNWLSNDYVIVKDVISLSAILLDMY